VGVSVLALLAVVVRKGGGMIVIANRVRVVVVMVSALAVAAGLLTLALLEKPAQAQAETITSNDRSTFNLPSSAWKACSRKDA
jgi:peptidoglycan/LPS O-acetylase OafA/YrhL